MLKAGLTDVESEQGFISEVSVGRAVDHLEAAKLCIWREVIIVKNLHTCLCWFCAVVFVHLSIAA